MDGAYFLKNESAMPVYRQCGHIFHPLLTFSGHQYFYSVRLDLQLKQSACKAHRYTSTAGHQNIQPPAPIARRKAARSKADTQKRY